VAKAYLRRFEELVIDFAARYRSDLFFRTTVLTIGIQVVFFIVICIITISLSFFYDNLLKKFIALSSETLSKSVGTTTAEEIARNISILQDNTTVLITGLVLLTTLIFSYLIAKLALTPARNALSLQKEFIRNIAHELRTPLAVVKTDTEVTLYKEFLPQSMRDLLLSHLSEFDRLSEIINNLVSINAFLRPDKMEFTSVDLGDVVESAVNKMTSLISHKKVRVVVQKDNNSFVFGNWNALEQIVLNILKNALNSTPEQGTIQISVRSFSKVELRIEDSGSGINPKDLHRIFEPFYRTDASRNRLNGGSGLGLTIVNELVKLHRGKITIRSALGLGTYVVISFPKRKFIIPPLSKKKNMREKLVIDYS